MSTVSLFCTPIWLGGGGGREARLGNFFSCGNNSLYSLSNHPLVRVPPVLRLSSPLFPEARQPFFVLSRNAPRHRERTQRTADCRLIELELRKVFGQSPLKDWASSLTGIHCVRAWKNGSYADR